MVKLLQARGKRQCREGGVGVAGGAKGGRPNHIKVGGAKNPEITIHHSVIFSFSHPDAANMVIIIARVIRNRGSNFMRSSVIRRLARPDARSALSQ